MKSLFLGLILSTSLQADIGETKAQQSWCKYLLANEHAILKSIKGSMFDNFTIKNFDQEICAVIFPHACARIINQMLLDWDSYKAGINATPEDFFELMMGPEMKGRMSIYLSQYPAPLAKKHELELKYYQDSLDSFELYIHLHGNNIKPNEYFRMQNLQKNWTGPNND